MLVDEKWRNLGRKRNRTQMCLALWKEVITKLPLQVIKPCLALIENNVKVTIMRTNIIEHSFGIHICFWMNKIGKFKQSTDVCRFHPCKLNGMKITR